MFYREPRISILARPAFQEPEHLRVQWIGDSSDGERVGQVRQIRDDAVMVERMSDPSIRVPIAFVRNVAGGKLVLTLAANKVGEMHWENAAQ